MKSWKLLFVLAIGALSMSCLACGGGDSGPDKTPTAPTIPEPPEEPTHSAIGIGTPESPGLLGAFSEEPSAVCDPHRPLF